MKSIYTSAHSQPRPTIVRAGSMALVLIAGVRIGSVCQVAHGRYLAVADSGAVLGTFDREYKAVAIIKANSEAF